MRSRQRWHLKTEGSGQQSERVRKNESEVLLDHFRERKRVSKDAVISSSPVDLLHHHTFWILKHTQHNIPEANNL